MTAVVTRGLTRTYTTGGRAVTALDAVDLVVERGEVRGLLGPNGAGKTTLCRILCTILLPSGGTARVLDHDVVSEAKAVKRSVGIVFGGDRGLYGRLTARQNLRFWAALYGLHGPRLRRRVDELLDRLGLTSRADERVDGFSRGMKQRLHLARGVIPDPPVLILDEPTAGMDPVAAHEFRSLLTDLRAGGRTVLMTTHDMAEAEAVCDRVTLADRGRILFTEDPAAVGRVLGGYERVDAAEVPDALREALSGLPGVVSTHAGADGRLRVETTDKSVTLAVLQLLVTAGVTQISVGRPSLQEVYLHLIGSRGMAVEP